MEQAISYSGTDKRCGYLGEFLQKQGCHVLFAETLIKASLEAASYTAVEPGNIVLLPLPAKKQLLSQLSACLQQGCTVIGGNLPEDFLSDLKQKNIHCIDYLKLPGIAMRNAVATAEGALCEAMLASDYTLQGSHSLVFGFGRCGEILSAKLKAMGSAVSISTRSQEAQAKALAYGFQLHKASAYGSYRFLFNTAPALVIKQEIIESLQADAVIIDIASGAGGTDFNCCAEHGITARLCPGLPGKYAPKTSAEIIFETVHKSLCALTQD